MNLKPKISLLLPTRKRPEWLVRFYDSAMSTADNKKQVEVVVYIDDDDDSYDNIKLPRLVKVRGPRVVLSEMWNACWKAARGEYFGHMGDDIIFRSPHWDTLVTQAIDAHTGKIAFVWGNDHSPESQRNVFGTHGFVHKNWTDTVGYFVPPYFVSDYNDTFFNEVARKLNVATYIHEIHTEHMHFSLGKALIDETTQDRLDRHERGRPEEIYKSDWFQQEMDQKRDALARFKDGHA